MQNQQQLHLRDGSQLNYGHLFNCTGLQADRVARAFGVGNHYKLLPFKGLYWQLKKAVHSSHKQTYIRYPI